MKSIINLYCGDSLEVMKAMPENKYDLAIVDPPYGIGINVSIGRRKGNKKSDYHKFAGGDTTIPNEEYFSLLKKISKNQIIWGGNYMTEHLNPSPCWLLWDKGFSEDVSFAQFEMAWTSFSSSAKKYDYNSAQNNNRIHPTQKPVQLYKWILSKYAKEGDTILDTHGGSMSHVIACIEMGFSIDCWELDKQYFEKAVERIQNHVKQLSMFQEQPIINIYR